jgi:hypothetical protein
MVHTNFTSNIYRLVFLILNIRLDLKYDMIIYLQCILNLMILPGNT